MVRQDRQRATLDKLKKENDPKEVWQGLRNLKKNHQPIPSGLWLGGVKKAGTNNKAKASAEFLQQILSNKSTDEMWNREYQATIITEELQVREDDFDINELDAIIKKLTRGKAAGPDQIPMG